MKQATVYFPFPKMLQNDIPLIFSNVDLQKKKKKTLVFTNPNLIFRQNNHLNIDTFRFSTETQTVDMGSLSSQTNSKSPRTRSLGEISDLRKSMTIMSAFLCSMSWSFSPFIPADSITAHASAKLRNLPHSHTLSGHFQRETPRGARKRSWEGRRGGYLSHSR